MVTILSIFLRTLMIFYHVYFGLNCLVKGSRMLMKNCNSTLGQDLVMSGTISTITVLIYTQ